MTGAAHVPRAAPPVHEPQEAVDAAALAGARRRSARRRLVLVAVIATIATLTAVGALLAIVLTGV